VDTSTPRTSAYLIVAGVALACLGMVLAGTAAANSAVPGDDGNLLGAWMGAVCALAGFVAAIAGLLRWAWRGRRAGTDPAVAEPARIAA
jgi:hypothetical protein